MKLSRKLLSALMSLTLIAAFTPMAFADEALTESKLPEMESAFATILQVNDRDDYKSVLVKTSDEREIVLNVNDDSIFLDNVTGKTLKLSDLKKDEKVLVYHSPFMTMSIPPQSYCFAIVTNTDSQLSTANLMRVGTINKGPLDGSVQFENTDGDFIITIPKDAPVVTLADQSPMSPGDINEGDLLFVWLGAVALSHPAQANAESVSVVSSGQDNNITIDLSGFEVFEQNGNTMIPLRSVSEQLGFDVKWVASTKQVVLDNGETTSTIRIGEDSYALTGPARSSGSVSYGSAPTIMRGLTYVPAQYVDLLLNSPEPSAFADGILVITVQ